MSDPRCVNCLQPVEIKGPDLLDHAYTGSRWCSPSDKSDRREATLCDATTPAPGTGPPVFGGLPSPWGSWDGGDDAA